MEFMLDTICDIKNNKKRPKDDPSHHTRIKKWLQKVCARTTCPSSAVMNCDFRMQLTLCFIPFLHILTAKGRRYPFTRANVE